MGRDQQFDRSLKLGMLQVASRGIEVLKQSRRVLVLFVPDLLCDVETLLRRFIVEAAKRSAGCSQRTNFVIAQRCGVRRKSPTIIRHARVNAIRFQPSHMLRINPAVGLGSGVAQIRVLFKRRFNNAGNCMPDGMVLGEQQKNSVTNLLHNIGHAVRSSHLHVAGRFVDRSVVQVHSKLFSAMHQIQNDARLRLFAKIEVSSIVPAAHAQTRDVLPRDER